MELIIKNISSRILLEKVDNGIILFEVSEENIVSSKLVYEVYYPDGIVDFDTIGKLVNDILEIMRVPGEEVETNRRLALTLVPIDPEKPMLEMDDENEDDED